MGVRAEPLSTAAEKAVGRRTPHGVVATNASRSAAQQLARRKFGAGDRQFRVPDDALDVTCLGSGCGFPTGREPREELDQGSGVVQSVPGRPKEGA